MKSSTVRTANSIWFWATSISYIVWKFTTGLIISTCISLIGASNDLRTQPIKASYINKVIKISISFLLLTQNWNIFCLWIKGLSWKLPPEIILVGASFDEYKSRIFSLFFDAELAIWNSYCECWKYKYLFYQIH